MRESLLARQPRLVLTPAAGPGHRNGAVTRAVRWRVAAVLLALVVAFVAIEPLRSSALRLAGRALVVDEPVATSDVVVISFPTNAMGIFEAADLVKAGFAARVALFRESSDSVQAEFARRGIVYPSGTAVAQQQLALLGVPSVEEIPFVVEGTEDQGGPLRAWFRQQQIHSAIVVTVPDHSRRLRRVLDRALDGDPIAVAVRVSRYSDFDPNYWWETRGGIRTGVVELQKLAFDIVRHPL
jgi:hypothetical protein